MAKRVIYFGPGPAVLPLQALKQAQQDMLSLGDTGISILEHSHRGKDYGLIHEETKALLRSLFVIPESHEILFMQGGASAQFALVPMNFLPAGRSADYVMTGVWSQKALAEARIVGKARVAATTEHDGVFTRVPRQDEMAFDPDAAYVHVTSNNTIFGTQFFDLPNTGAVPLVVDMSSDLGWRPVDFSRLSLVYAGAQKNLGPAGVTLVIARKDLLDKGRTDIPKIFRYSTIAAGDSLQNTVPTFAIYMVRNVLRWVKGQGGLEAMERRNRSKAELLYRAVDARPDFYLCPVEKGSRSLMNAVFRLPSEDLEKELVAQATARGMVGLKGHRSVGGIRVSMYNACEPADVATLVAFLDEFAKAHA